MVGNSTSGQYGNLTLNADGSYSYDVANNSAAVQALGIGDKLTEIFTYTIADADGDSSIATLTITIIGRNDQPTITADNNGNIADISFTEQTTESIITQSGAIAFNDFDTTDTLTLGYLKGQNQYEFNGNTTLTALTPDQKAALEGMFLASQATNNSGTWNINATSTALNFIPAGETITIRYAVQVNDNEGITTAGNGNEFSKSEIRYVEVTITGTNDGISLINDKKTVNEDSNTSTGNIFANDVNDPDVGETLVVESYSVLGMTGIVPGTTTTLIPDGTNAIGTMTVNSDGSYSFKPAANYSGEVPTITANVSNGLPIGDLDRSSGSETLVITVKPVSDAPILEIGDNVIANKGTVTITTKEDTKVALGLSVKIKDDKDLDTSSNDDSPERIGFITLSGIPSGVTLDYGSGSYTNTSNSNKNITIKLSDVPTINTIATPTITMTKAQFEAMELTPPADNATNISIGMSVTEYEVNANGDIARVNADGKVVAAGSTTIVGATSTATIKVDVQAVTDTSGNNQAGDDFSEFGYTAGVAGVAGDTFTVTVNEGEYITLPIVTTFGDLVGGAGAKETYGFVIKGLVPGTVIEFTAAGSTTATEYTAGSNGQVLIGATANSTGAITSTSLTTNNGSQPKIQIKSGQFDSQDMNGVTVDLYTQDKDPDSSHTIVPELIDSVIVDMTVLPIAGQVKLDNQGVSTFEDMAVTLGSFKFKVLDDKDGAGAETITQIQFTLPTDWTFADTANSGAATQVGNTVTIDMNNPSADLSQMTVTPPAQSSTDTEFSFTVSTSDPDDDTGTAVTGDATLTQIVVVTPVAETVGNGVTINPDNNYGTTITASEDMAFALNQGGFNLKDGWSNQDDTVNFGVPGYTGNQTDSEETLALLTFGNKVNGVEDSFTSVVGAVFTYNDGTSLISLTDNGDGVEIPAAYLDTVTVKPPQDYSDFSLAAGSSTVVKVNAITRDYGEDPSDVMVEATSGESFLTFDVKGVADKVTLAVDPAYGNEDQAIIGTNSRDDSSLDPAAIDPSKGIELNIRPSSRDNDGSEVYNVTIDNIPAGSKLYIGAAELTITNGSVTISDYTNTVSDLYFVPPENFSGKWELKVTATGVESDGDTFTTPTLDLPIKVTGKADLIVGDDLALATAAVINASGQPVNADYTVIGTEGNSINVSSFFENNAANIGPYDDGSSDPILNPNTNNAEAISYSITGVPENFNITGAGVVFLGGSGTDRTWSLTLDAVKNTAQLTTPEHFAGDISFNITGTTTERVSGNSVKHDTKPVSVLITPDAADGSIAPKVIANEDAWTTINFKAAFKSNDTKDVAKSAMGYEALESINFKGEDLINLGIILQVTKPDNSVELIDNPQAGQSYDYTANDKIEFKYNAANEHSDASIDIPFDYTYTDTASLGLNGANNSITTTSSGSSASVNVTFQALTDAPTIDLDIANADNTINNDGSDNTASVTVSVTSPDKDGSESFTRLEVRDVPEGIIVQGGILSNGVWYVDVPDQAITTGPNPSYNLMLERDGSTANIFDEDKIITITVITQDINGLSIDGNEKRDSQEFTLVLSRTDPGTNPGVPDLVNELTVNPITPDEDTSFNLGDVLDVTLKSSNINSVDAYSFALTDVPKGTEITSGNPAVVVQKIGGQWIISVDRDSNGLIVPENALDAITVALPPNFSTNVAGQEFSFGAIFTARDNEGREDVSAGKQVDIIVKPVTDEFDSNGDNTRVTIDEDATVDIKIDLKNSADGDYVALVDGKLYIQVNESLQTGTGGAGTLTDAGGNALNTVTLTADQVGSIPAGDYYELIVSDQSGTIDGINPTETVTVKYTPAENADGTTEIKVYTQHKEVSSVADHGAVIDYEHTYDITVTAQPDALDIFELNTTDRVVTAIGDEDTEIFIPYEIKQSDENDTATGISLDNVPNDYLVFYLDASGNEQLANNNGNINGIGNLWTINATDLNAAADNIFIKPPENVSGIVSGIQMKVVSDSGLVSLPLDVTLEVLPVADGVVFNPTEAIGNQGKWTALNLNAVLEDVDGSETVTMVITDNGAGLAGDVLRFKVKTTGDILTASWNGSNYTITGITPEQVNDLQIQSSVPLSGDLSFKLSTTDTATGLPDSTSAGVTETVAVDIAFTAKFDGSPEDDILDASSQGSAVNYKGGAGDDTLIGGTSKDVLEGGAGDDFLNGNVGADTLRGGAGNDTLVFQADNIVMDGGSGIDTLLINTAGTTIDFGSFDSTVFESFEVIEMTGNGAQSLTNLTTSDVLDIINDTVMTNKDLIINGDNADNVQLSGNDWTNTGTTQQGGNSYNVYSFSDINGTHNVLIDTDITTSVI